ncbi:hypothetical protein M0802_016419 [Mischocyttarus mexicanus]|nr:hypothetical protein M0802_016419 [Mischocyttarus mexicanus]
MRRWTTTDNDNRNNSQQRRTRKRSRRKVKVEVEVEVEEEEEEEEEEEGNLNEDKDGLLRGGRTFADGFCFRTLSRDNVATMLEQWRHYDGYRALKRMGSNRETIT